MNPGKSEWSIYLSAMGPLLKSLPLLRLRADSRYTIADYIEGQVAKYGDLPFILFEDRRITYREYNAMANRFAHWGLSVGLRAGDTIGFMMANRAEYVPVWSGFAKIGVKAALINTNLVGSGVLHALEVVGANRLLLGAECAPSVYMRGASPSRSPAEGSFMRGASPSRSPAEGSADLADDALSNLSVYVLPEEGAGDPGLPGAEDIRKALAEQPESDPDPAVRASVRSGDSVFHIYTSGTTGLPKATNMSHQKLALGGLSGAVLGLRKGEVVYCPLPLYHAAGGVGTVMMAMGCGGAVAIARRFSASRFWDDVRRYHASGVIYIGELCRFLLNRPPDPEDGTHNLRWMFGIGLRADVWEPFRERFRIPRIVEAYGATEANVGGVNYAGKVGSVGRIRGGLLLRYDVEREDFVRDAEGRHVECRPGEVGELLGRIPVGSRSMLRQFQGYTSAEATEKKILRGVKKPDDAYFRSGDLLRRDRKGYYYFVDRIGDTFRWKGENVSTQEVAEALSAFPGVETANVYGVEVPGHEGRAGMAALALEGGREAPFDAQALYELAVSKLPSYAVPVFLRLQSESDVTGTFKLRKVALRSEGYDPNATSDPIYVRDDQAGAYVRLHEVEDAHVR